MKRVGFTLIELLVLVVVSIIALLVAIISPSLPTWTPGHSQAGLNDGVLLSGGYTRGQSSGDALAYLHGDGSELNGYSSVVFADGHVGTAHIWETRDVTFDPKP